MGAIRFMIPWEMAIFFSVTFLSGKSSLFSAVMAITAFPKVNGIWGSVKSSVPTTRSFQVIAERLKTGSLKPTWILASSDIS